MGYLYSIKWDTIKKDLQRGLDQGFIAMKKGVLIARKKAGDLSEEGNRQYKLIMLKTKVHKDLLALGARVYSLVAANNNKNSALDAKVKDITAHIKRYEAEITLLEKKQRKTVKRRINRAA